MIERYLELVEKRFKTPEEYKEMIRLRIALESQFGQIKGGK